MPSFENDPCAVLEWLYGPDARFGYISRLTISDRPGQAFMNVLRAFDPASYARLSGSSVDPFYVDAKLPLAIDRLTSK